MRFTHKNASKPRLAFNLQQYNRDVETLVSETIKLKIENPKFVYDFYIDALGRELEAIYNSDTINLPPFVESLLFFPTTEDVHPQLLRNTGKFKKLNLTRWNVACSPREKRRVAQVIRHVQEDGYHRRESDECEGYAYPLLNFAVVTNAHHHSMAARVLRADSLVMDASVVDISAFFSDLRVGSDFSWYYTKRDYFNPERPDPRFALMYDLARRRAVWEASPNTFLEKRVELCSLINVEEDFLGIELKEDIFAPLRQPPVSAAQNLEISLKSSSNKLIMTEGELPAIKRVLLRMMKLEIKDGQIFQAK